MTTNTDPLTPDEQAELIRNAQRDGLLFDRFVGTVPVFARAALATPPLDAERLLDEVVRGLNAKKRHQYTSWYDVQTILDVVRHAFVRLSEEPQ